MAPVQSKSSVTRRRSQGRRRAPKSVVAPAAPPTPAPPISPPIPPPNPIPNPNTVRASVFEGTPAAANPAINLTGLSDDEDDEPRGVVLPHGGRQTGANTYTSTEVDILLDTLTAILPRCQRDWDEVRTIYNEEVSQGRQRETHNLRTKFNRLLKMIKPTGTGEADRFHERALEIEDMMHNQEEAAALDDTWSVSEASDTELAPLPPPLYAPLNANAVLSIAPLPPVLSSSAAIPRAPAPPPFSNSKGKAVAHPRAPAAPRPAPKARAPPAVPSKEVIELDSDSDVVVVDSKANTPRPKRKAGHEPTLRVRKAAVTPAPTKSNPPRPRKSATVVPAVEPIADRLVEYLDPEIDRMAADKRHMDDMVRMMIYDKDRTIENLRRELSEEKERRHQAERQLDHLNMVVTWRGLALPAAAGGQMFGSLANGQPMVQASVIQPSNAAQPTFQPAFQPVLQPILKPYAPVIQSVAPVIQSAAPVTQPGIPMDVDVAQAACGEAPVGSSKSSPLAERTDASGSGLRPDEK